MTKALFELLSPQRLTEVVDIGANPIDGQPPYAAMLAAGICYVTGFEPQEEALLELQQNEGPNEKYLPYAVGDGGTHTLNICLGSGMTGFFEPDPATLSVFEVLKQTGKVLRRVPVETRRLDDISEVRDMDFLKIDVQGSELSVFKGGVTKLSQAVAVQTEVSFVKLYMGQPSIGDVDLELRSQGLVPHCFAEVKKHPIAPCVVNNDPRMALNQLTEADLVYVRDFFHPEGPVIVFLKKADGLAHPEIG